MGVEKGLYACQAPEGEESGIPGTGRQDDPNQFYRQQLYPLWEESPLPASLQQLGYRPCLEDSHYLKT